MTADSAVPEELFRYSDATTGASADLQRWVRTVLAPAIERYRAGAVTHGRDIPGVTLLDASRTISDDVLVHLLATHEADAGVRRTGRAFEEAGGSEEVSWRRGPIQGLPAVETSTSGTGGPDLQTIGVDLAVARRAFPVPWLPIGWAGVSLAMQLARSISTMERYQHIQSIIRLVRALLPEELVKVRQSLQGAIQIQGQIGEWSALRLLERSGESVFDLNRLTGGAANFRLVDLISDAGLYSVKTYETAEQVLPFVEDLVKLQRFVEDPTVATKIAAGEDRIRMLERAAADLRRGAGRIGAAWTEGLQTEQEIRNLYFGAGTEAEALRARIGEIVDQALADEARFDEWGGAEIAQRFLDPGRLLRLQSTAIEQFTERGIQEFLVQNAKFLVPDDKVEPLRDLIRATSRLGTEEELERLAARIGPLGMDFRDASRLARWLNTVPKAERLDAFLSQGARRMLMVPRWITSEVLARAADVPAVGRFLRFVSTVADSPAGRMAGRVLRWGGPVLSMAADISIIASPSQNAWGGAKTEQTAAWVSLGVTGVTLLASIPAVSGVLAANAALDWIPGVGEAVMLGTAVYFVGDLAYQNNWFGFHNFADHAASTASNIASEAFDTGKQFVGGLVQGGLNDLANLVPDLPVGLPNPLSLFG